MRLSKTTNYAIRILLDCAVAEPNLVKVAEISERRDITLQNTFKIVHLLSRAGFIRAVRGRHGGVRLARPAADIRLGDVVRAMEILHLEVEREEGERGGAHGQLAALDQLFDNALGAFISVLDEHTLDQMIKVQRKETSGSGARQKSKGQRRTKTLAVSGSGARRQQAGHG
ncbi:Rrf2 family transcriptional regulator [Hyphomicrobium sp.]|uniref:RrF2 family transcriptional regulator n=1 Tax=Hyphomicrobium sp. TaxID=82 RepID=UPI0025C0ADBA|nr:Rrf2 family transcriptional regulator [Hyphomicrobium sp.]MCC7252126.1 Rrf2 family transcriptional regulator [Hyphomicrobium sp.]